MKLTGGTFLLSLFVVVYSVHRDSMECSLEGRMAPKTHMPLLCILECFHRSNCTSVQFDNKAYVCSEISKTPGTTALSMDTTLIALQCRVHEMKYGRPCSLDTECSEKMAGTICNEGFCACDPTLRYSPSLTTCKACGTDGDTFSSYRGLGISYNNAAVYYVENSTACEMHCLQQKNFTCRSAEYDTMAKPNLHKCNLSWLTYGEISFDNRSVEDLEWIFLIRNCA